MTAFLNKATTYGTLTKQICDVSCMAEFPPSQYWAIRGRLATAGQPKLIYREVSSTAKADIPKPKRKLSQRIFACLGEG